MSNLPNKSGSKAIAVLSNEITKCSFNLSLMEHRIIKQYISRIKYTEVIDSRELYVLNIKEFANFWGINAADVRDELLTAGKTLFDRYIFKGDPNGSYSYSRWITFFNYNKEEDSISIRWSEELVQHICQLRERFVKLDLMELIDLKSIYSWRLYEILVTTIGENSYKNPSFTPEQLMFMMDVPESCKVYKTFKGRVLKVAVEELKTKVKRFSKMNMVEEKENGKRKVIGVGFEGVGVGNRYKGVTSL